MHTHYTSGETRKIIIPNEHQWRALAAVIPAMSSLWRLAVIPFGDSAWQLRNSGFPRITLFKVEYNELVTKLKWESVRTIVGPRPRRRWTRSLGLANRLTLILSPWVVRSVEPTCRTVPSRGSACTRVREIAQVTMVYQLLVVGR